MVEMPFCNQAKDGHVTCLRRVGGLMEEDGLAMVSEPPERACTVQPGISDGTGA